MRKISSFAVVFSLVILGSLLYGLFSPSPYTRIPPPSIASPGFPIPRSQADNSRAFKKVAVSKIYTLAANASLRGQTSNPEGALIEPLIVKADGEGNFYVLDWGDFCVKKYSSEAKFLGSFAERQASQKGSLANPTDFSLDQRHRIWIVDPKQSCVAIFDSPGDPTRTISSKNSTYRIAPSFSGGYVSMPGAPNRFLFEAFDPAGNLVNQFGSIVPDQDEYQLSFDGHITQEGDTTYFAFSRGGYLVAYGASGDLKFFVETIASMPFPSIDETKFGSGVRRRVDPDAGYSSLDITIRGSHLYVLAAPRSAQEEDRIVDLYKTADGSYEFSFRIPEKCFSFAATGDILYTIAGNSIVKWRYAII